MQIQCFAHIYVLVHISLKAKMISLKLFAVYCVLWRKTFCKYIKVYYSLNNICKDKISGLNPKTVSYKWKEIPKSFQDLHAIEYLESKDTFSMFLAPSRSPRCHYLCLSLCPSVPPLQSKCHQGLSIFSSLSWVILGLSKVSVCFRSL